MTVVFVSNTTTYTVTPKAVGHGGSILPDTSQKDKTASFTITPDAGYVIKSVSGCGSTYTTAPITGKYMVKAEFSKSRKK